jgi:ABC-type molybdenum transport system ATPase subunit/photorepair protein PhrA
MPDDPHMTHSNIVPFRTLDLPETADVILRAEDITLARKGRKLINGLSFSIEQTGITTLLGPNGAGKSLILRMIVD